MLLCVVACRGCILPDRNLGRTVTPSEIVGTWRLTPESLRLLERDGFKPLPDQTFTMTFAEDGAARFASIDPWEPTTYAVRAGTWALVHGTPQGRTNVLELRLQGAGESGTSFVNWNFDEVGGSLVLWSFLGDPDSWEFVEYTRAP